MSSVERPWGFYESVHALEDHHVKFIRVEAGQRLSYQKQRFRAEHWFIVSGQAKVTHNGAEIEMSAGDSIDMAQGDLHRLANIGSEPVVFIEVQTGTYFGEDDIERIEDDYNR